MKKLIILDRDGILNAVVVDPEQGTIGSPLHPSQVEILPSVPEALAVLKDLGFTLAIATNQPAWAKGQTTRSNLDAVHERVLAEITSRGAQIQSSQICFHKREDQCLCRKPQPGLLNEILKQNPDVSIDDSWMVGDGVTDIEVGVSVGLKTAFLGPRKCDACKILESRDLIPSFWGKNILEFAEYLKKKKETR